MKRIVSLVSAMLIFAVSFGFANGQQGGGGGLPI
jgi:hypothetical protein